jgi:hypothetical protein
MLVRPFFATTAFAILLAACGTTSTTSRGLSSSSSAVIRPSAENEATGQCLLAPEVEAEQAILYQTDLMIISDTCGSDSYRTFTVHNRSEIVGYQRQIMNQFRRAGTRSPQAKLDSYLTNLANERSLAIGREKVQTVCHRFAAMLDDARSISGEQFRGHIARLALENGKADPKCASGFVSER